MVELARLYSYELLIPEPLEFLLDLWIVGDMFFGSAYFFLCLCLDLSFEYLELCLFFYSFKQGYVATVLKVFGNSILSSFITYESCKFGVQFSSSSSFCFQKNLVSKLDNGEGFYVCLLPDISVTWIPCNSVWVEHLMLISFY